MDLFNQTSGRYLNLLPFDGDVNYYGQIMTGERAGHYYSVLMKNLDWRNDEVIIMGKKITTKRSVSWYGDRPFEYTYSGITKRALEWTDELLELKSLTEKETGETYNSCLCNLYHSGEEGMSWHSDGEPDLKANGTIASLSFGAGRKFAFKHKRTKQKVELILEHGSLLVMKGVCQTFWLHGLPPAKKILKPRINLTFRTVLK